MTDSGREMYPDVRHASVETLRARIRELEQQLELERNGGQGAIAAYHAQLDSLGAPPDPWPCIRVGKLVRQLKATQREDKTS